MEESGCQRKGPSDWLQGSFSFWRLSSVNPAYLLASGPWSVVVSGLWALFGESEGRRCNNAHHSIEFSSLLLGVAPLSSSDMRLCGQLRTQGGLDEGTVVRTRKTLQGRIRGWLSTWTSTTLRFVYLLRWNADQILKTSFPDSHFHRF